MNKVIAIHLRGTAFQLEEEGYEALRGYLDGAARTLAANPDQAEILADIEQAIADKFRVPLGDARNVVLTADVKAVIAEMGPVSDGSNPAERAAAADARQSAANPGEDSADAPEFSAAPRRLHTLREGALICGVCNGIAAYLGLDVTLVRLGVVVLCFFSFGTLAALYFIAAMIIPEAKTPEQKAAARGPSPTAQEFIRRAQTGYYEGLKSVHDRESRRAWKRKFRRQMRQAFAWDWTGGNAPGCPPPPPLSAGSYLLLGLLSTLKTLLALAAVIVAVSLLATGTILGAPFPETIPHWIGLLFLFLAYKFAAAPLKFLRRAIWYGHSHRPGGWRWNPFAELWHGLVAVCFAVLFIWLADRFVPQFHTGLQHLPVLLHQIADSVREWWRQT